jgi:hypothetical protein
MKPITAPLFRNNPNNQPAEVTNLQDDLLLRLRKHVSHTDQQQFLEDGLSKEQQA